MARTVIHFGMILILAASGLSACGGGGSGSDASSPTQPSPTGGNNPPMAFDVGEKVNVNQSLTAMLDGRDADGDPLTHSITELPSLGSVTLVNSTTGEFRYTPDPDVFGTDLFRYRVNDGVSNSTEGVVTIVLNRPPIAQSASVGVATNKPKSTMLPGSDADGDNLKFQIMSPPNNGIISSLEPATGEYVYVANAGYEGPDSFTFLVNDGFADSTTETVDIKVDEWHGTMNLGMAGEDEITYGLGIDSESNLYVAYNTDGVVAGAQSNGGIDVVVAKIDRKGSIVWQKQWGYAGDETPYQLVVDPNGYLYVTVHTHDENSDGPNFVLKFDRDGHLVWELVTPQPEIFNLLYRMGVAPNGNLYVSLRGLGAGILKVNADGTTGWVKYLGTTAEDPDDPLFPGNYTSLYAQARGLAVDANETVYTYVSANYMLEGDSTNYQHGILVGVDNAGWIQARIDPLSASAYPPPLNDSRMGDLSLTNTGNLRMTGFYNGQLAVAEFDIAGNEIWSTTIGDPGMIRYGFRGAVLADGSSVSTGALHPEVTNSGEQEDVHMTKLSSQGAFLWERVIDSSPTDGSLLVQDGRGQPVVDGDGDIFMVVTSFGGSIGAQPNQGGADPLLLKLDGGTGRIIDSNLP